MPPNKGGIYNKFASKNLHKDKICYNDKIFEHKGSSKEKKDEIRYRCSVAFFITPYKYINLR